VLGVPTAERPRAFGLFLSTSQSGPSELQMVTSRSTHPDPSQPSIDDAKLIQWLEEIPVRRETLALGDGLEMKRRSTK